VEKKAVKNFIDTGAGVVDADFRGPLGIVLFNFDNTDYKGTRLTAFQSFH
jgi:dUTP pyrophosphatase